MQHNARLVFFAPFLLLGACNNGLQVEDVKVENVVDECSCIENLAVTMEDYTQYIEENRALFQEASGLINSGQTLPAELDEKFNAFMTANQTRGELIAELGAACQAHVDFGGLLSGNVKSECEGADRLTAAMTTLNEMQNEPVGGQ